MKSAQQLWARLKTLKLASSKRKTATLRNIYLDTADHALIKAGISLRLRRDGRRWIQTVKFETALHGGLSRVDEVANPAPGGRPCVEAILDESIRDKVRHHLNGSPLQPVCETLIRRSANELSLSEGTRVELAIDVGEIRPAGNGADLRKAVIGLIEGSLGSLIDIAHALFPDGGFNFILFSKTARGYMLAKGGQIDLPLAPRNAEEIALRGDRSVEEAARDILRECFEHVAVNLRVVRKLDDREGPHLVEMPELSEGARC